MKIALKEQFHFTTSNPIEQQAAKAAFFPEYEKDRRFARLDNPAKLYGPFVRFYLKPPKVYAKPFRPDPRGPVMTTEVKMKERQMNEPEKRLFVGMKISSKLQAELDHCARGTEHYFKQNNPESLQLVNSGTDRLIGRFVRDGFPVNDIDNVSRNVRSIITLIAPGYRIADDSLRIYTDPEADAASPA